MSTDYFLLIIAATGAMYFQRSVSCILDLISISYEYENYYLNHPLHTPHTDYVFLNALYVIHKSKYMGNICFYLIMFCISYYHQDL